MTKLGITLTPEEQQALVTMATADLRYPHEQLRWLLKQEAERRGIWPPALFENSHSPHEVTA